MGGSIAAGTLGLIAEYFLKTTAVLTLALLAARASRRRPAAFRHFVLSFALIGLLLIPLLSLAPVGWQTSLLPARPAGPGTATIIPVRPGMTGAQTLDPNDLSLPLTMVRLPDLSFATTADGPAGAATHSLPAAGADPLNSLLAVLWAAGLIVLFLRLAIGLAGAVKLTAQGTALGDPAWRLLLERFKALVSLRRNIRLRGHPEVLVPMTWGWRKPVVLMPAGADAWTEEQRSSALFHELSHVKRADFLVMLLVRTSLAAFWFNPLCWVVYRELRKEQEIACDELVLRAGIRPSTYAASLLAFRRSAGFRWNPSAALLGMLGRSSFHERLAAILKQKLTFKEVKMKTKIMLASAVVLAVALVGTARPAAGTEKTAVKTAIVETATPAASAIAFALPAAGAQETKAATVVVQEKEKEKAKAAEKAEKEKAVIEKKIVVTTKDGAKTPIVITITEGDKVRTLTLDRPLTITSGEGGHVLVLSSEGKDVQVLEGDPLRLEIKGGELELIKEGKVLKVGEGGVYQIIKEGDKEGSHVVVYRTPTVTPTKGKEIHVVKEGEAWTAAEPGKEGKEGAVWIAKEFSEKPFEGAWMSEGGKAFAFSPATDKEMLEKVHALQEQVAAIKAKKMDITDLEESLKKLEAELAANSEKIGKLHMTFEERPAGITVVKKIGEDEAKGDVVVYEKVRGDKAEGATSLWFAKRDEAGAIAKVGVFKGDNSIQIVLVNKETGPADFERAVVSLKKGLPDGCKLMEQKFDAEEGTMTFRIASPEGKKFDEQTVRKLVDSLTGAIKTKK
jgi:beta-lactamase regulating signal transducer with metallopeptidase domain